MSLNPSPADPIRRPRGTYDSAMAKLEQDTIRSVNYDMSGQNVERVHAVLMARFNARLPGVALDHANLLKVAAAISAGTYPA
ncbi:MAG: hypothetical protein J2P22_00130 [Nocardioides sp.]|nr:hypothetical protein [Nocardioides sp.]